MTGPAPAATIPPPRGGRLPKRVVSRSTRLLRRVVSQWRASLQFRVVTVTMVLSLVVVGLLGPMIVTQLRAGLVRSAVQTSLSQVTQGVREAQLELASSESGTSATGDAIDINTLLTEMTQDLCSDAAGHDTYQVLVLTPQFVPNAVETTEPAHDPRACGGQLLPRSVPKALSDEVVRSTNIYYAPVRLQYGPNPTTVTSTASGLMFGRQIEDARLGSIDVYYAFPFVREKATLELVSRWLAAAGGFLVLALALIAWVVTRQVVTPVRMAAGIAERLAAGRLEERMRVRGEDDLARLASSFNKMATHLQSQIHQLEELSRVQRRFVSDVSHELRTPLTTVRMASYLLYEARESFEPAVARSAELLQNQLDRFEELLTDLLEISRFDAGAANLDEAEPVDLRELVSRVTEGAAPLAERKGSVITVSAPTEACIAEVDSRRIERILRNLVVNAIEHGEGREVVVKLAMSDDAVAIAVRDYGVGLSPAEVPLVFNRFWRADPARARTTGGTGLGLAIAQEDAHLHHGWLQAWGEPGGGSQFRLTLPRVIGSQRLRSSPLPLEPADARDRSAVVLPRAGRRPLDTAGVAATPSDAGTQEQPRS